MSISLSVCQHIVNGLLCIMISGIEKQMFAILYHKQKQITRKSLFQTTQKYRYALQNSNTSSFTHCENTT